MTIKKIKGEFCTVHCTGPDAGKPIACFPTKEEADRQHRAIEASKARARKIEIDINEL